MCIHEVYNCKKRTDRLRCRLRITLLAPSLHAAVYLAFPLAQPRRSGLVGPTGSSQHVPSSRWSLTDHPFRAMSGGPAGNRRPEPCRAEEAATQILQPESEPASRASVERRPLSRTSVA